ncbi:MAG TPA: extracellular solute-binding protein, partial [Candidatus Avipropionibacterium avicola]|nr:extracellular solute-binding protein [Candidatus Avipropionibacterium avicola]
QGTGGGGNGGGGETGLVEPTFVPFAGVTPDKPGSADGITPVFYNYPNPPTVREGYPLEGGEKWSALMQMAPPKVAASKNKNYQLYRDALGTDFEVNGVLSAAYTEKFQVIMAGGDLPDFVQIASVAQLPKLLEKNFTDLTDVLGGDEIKKYPGLANIPTATWKIPQLNGRLWGIAQPRPPAGVSLTSRGDVLAERGIDDPYVQLRDGADFVDLLKQLTNKDKNEFAMGADPNGWLMPMMQTMIGGPNVWANENGTFVHQLETEQYKEALSEAGKIIQAGYLHPNSFSDPTQNATWYNAGTTALYYQSFVGWGGNARLHPEWNVGNVELPMWDGGGMAPIRKSVAGYGAYIAIKKSDDARLEQLLRIADFIASPFGTQQYLDVNYGVEGYSYNMEDGNPVSLPPETNPSIVAMTYTGGNSGAILFGQGEQESVDRQHEYLSRAIPAGIDNAVDGLYSETFSTKGATFTKAQFDLQREIMLGQKPVSDFDDFVKKWKSQVGDKAAAEYAESAEAVS